MSVLSPAAKLQFTDITGAPLVGGFLYTYAAGTTTPLATYTDSSGTSLNSNPVVLNARGEASVWLGANTYKFKLTDSNNTEIWTVDNITAPTSALSPVLSGNVVINTDSSSPALKITQVGTGAVLRVQDSTDPDVTPFIIDNIGQVGIGTASPAAALDMAGGTFQLSSSAGASRTTLSADATDSIFAATDDRNFTVKTNTVTRLTVNSTAATSTVPVVLPGVPTTSLQAATKSYVDLGSPAGIIATFAGTSAPSGWLACNGAIVSQTTYATLFAAIGATWNTGGEGAGNFRLPDLRGMFLRGTGTNATGSSSGAIGPSVGGYDADTYLNHNHAATSTDAGHTHSFTETNGSGAAAAGIGGQGVNNFSGTTGSGNASITTTVNTSTTGGTETKPKNYGVLYIIKT
jgi:microcystin-dependent protein